MAILYIVTAWVVLQVADVLFDALELPPEWTRLVLALLVLGFPIALIFSWLFRITPDGIEADGPADRDSRRMNILVVVLLLIGIGGLVVDRLLPEWSPGSSEELRSLSVEPYSIAVLPFEDLSPDGDHEHFSTGLSEELLNLLVKAGNLQVASRTSSFAYRDSTMGIPAIADELKVAHILEGSVRKDGDRIRITAQLIDTRTDRHLWSDNFDRDFDDIFAIQDEIANAIVDRLAEELGLIDVARVSAVVVTRNLDAYQLYLEARELFVRRIRISESIDKFNQAIALDPEFARAWEGLAAVEVIADDWLWGPNEDGIDHISRAEEPARRALELDPKLSMPYAVLGQLSARLYRNQVDALSYFETAVEMDPTDLTAMLWLGTFLKYAGYLDESIAALERCLEVDPTRAICADYLAEAHFYNGNTELAVRLHGKSLESQFMATAPSFVSYYTLNGQRELALMIAQAKMGGRGAPVIEWIRAIEDPDADHRPGLARLNDWVRQTNFRMGLPPQMLFSFNAHEQMMETGDMQRRMLFHPDAAEFRETPQFKEIIRYWGFDDLWRDRGFPPQCRPLGSDDFECD